MTLLSPTEALPVHIEALPRDFKLTTLHYTEDRNRHGQSALIISSWLDQGPSCPVLRNRERNNEDFVEAFCEDCTYHFDIEEYDTDDHLLDVSVAYKNQECEIYSGSIKIYSPCPCYSNGVESVDYPCLAGHSLDDFLEEAPNEDTAESVSMDYMRFSVALNPRHNCARMHVSYNDGVDRDPYTAVIQRIERSQDGSTWLATPEFHAINTYSPHGEVCWGHRFSRVNSLAVAADAYFTTPCNEDLGTAAAHLENQEEASNYPDPGTEENWERHYNAPIYDNAPRLEFTAAEPGAQYALVVATAQPSTLQQFLLLAAAPGAQLLGAGTAALLVRWHDNVPVANGQTISCWLSEAGADSNRWLLTPDTSSNEFHHNGLLIGQLPIPQRKLTHA